MEQLKNLHRGVLPLAFCAAMLPCAAQDSTNRNHAMHHSQADSIKKYVIIKSWEHQRELYIAKGMSEAEADSIIADDLAYLSAMDRTAGNDLIGVKARPFEFDGWLNSEPLTLEDLKGHVLLVRWFTDTCPFCASSTPAFRQLPHMKCYGK